MLRSIVGQPFLIGLVVATCLLISAATVLTRAPSYSASTTLHVVNLRLSMSGRDDAFYAESQFDPTFLETQIQIIASETIADKVIARINLEPEPAKPGLLDFLNIKLPSSVTTTPDADLKKSALLKSFSKSLAVSRIGQSNLVEIRYTDSIPSRASAVANEVAKAYLEKINDDRLEAAQAGSGWLRDRLREIGAKAQIVSQANTPTTKSDLPGSIILAASGLVGVIAGMFLALLRAFSDNKVRSPEQLAEICNIGCLGIVPKIGSRENNTARLTWVARNAFSPLWQTLRQAGVITDGEALSSRLRYVGLTSTLPGEGKTVMAANFAAMMANAGKKVLLVDAQPYHPSLSRAFTAQSAPGLIEFLGDTSRPLSEYVQFGEVTGLEILPLGGGVNSSHTAQLLWSNAMKRFMSDTSGYDIVIFDLPPMIASGDLRAAAAYLDAMIFVAAWGKVREAEIRSAINLIPTVRDKMIGVILNKVNRRGMRRISSPEASFLSRQSRLARYQRQ
jgi:Mrp family chromosome partitioning ATPase/capsular polysaccharide biosynthesis protein